MAEQLSIFGDVGYRVMNDGSKRQVRPNTPPAYFLLPMWKEGYPYTFGPAESVWSQANSMYVDPTPGTYKYPSDNVFHVIPDTFWASVLTDERNGDHHTPNPLVTAWYGGTLHMEPYSYYQPQYGVKSEGAIASGDVTGNHTIRNGVSQKWFSTFWDLPTIYGTSASWIWDLGWSHYGVSPMESNLDHSTGSCTYAWNDDGSNVIPGKFSLYGPNYATVTSGTMSATVHLRNYANWSRHGYSDHLAGELTCTATLLIKEFQVTQHGILIAIGDISQVYDGWYVQLAGLGPNITVPISGSRIIKYADMAGKGYPVHFARASSGRTPVVNDPTQCELAKDFVRASVAMKSYYDELDYEKHADEIRANQREALSNDEALKSNWLENLTGLKKPLSLVHSVVDLTRAFKSRDPAKITKGVAGAYLAWKYVIAPGVNDYEDVKTNAGDLWDTYVASSAPIVERRRATTTRPIPDKGPDTGYTSITTTYNMSLSADSFSRIWRALCSFGVEPSVANLWDLVPYSFVVDWFVPIGDALDTVSKLADGTLIYDDVTWCTSYVRDEMVEYTALGNSIPSTLHYHFCKRVGGCGFPPLSPWEVATSCDKSATVSQTIQGAALVAQKVLP